MCCRLDNGGQLRMQQVSYVPWFQRFFLTSCIWWDKEDLQAISQYIYLHCEVKKIITSLLFYKKIFILVTLVVNHCCSPVLPMQCLIVFTLISCKTSHYGNDYLQCHFLSFSDYPVKLQWIRQLKFKNKVFSGCPCYSQHFFFLRYHTLKILR